MCFLLQRHRIRGAVISVLGSALFRVTAVLNVGYGVMY